MLQYKVIYSVGVIIYSSSLFQWSLVLRLQDERVGFTWHTNKVQRTQVV